MAASRDPRATRPLQLAEPLRLALSRIARRARAVPQPLVLVLTAATLLAVAWALVLPPFQGPDESEHFAYVQHLAETGSAPSSTTFSGAGSHSSEETFALDRLGLRAMMAVPEALPLWNDADQERWRAFERQVTPSQRGDGDGANPIAKNPPLYYAYEAVAYRVSPGDSLYDRLLATRLASALLFVLTVAFAWLAAAELSARVWVRTLTAGIVALQPQLTSMAGIVNADMMLVAVWSAFTALAVRTLVRGPSARRVLGLSVLAAASSLTHGRGLALLPALAIVLALAFWHHRPPLRSTLRWSGAGALVLVLGLAVFRFFTSASGGGSLYGNQTDYINQGGFSPPELLSLVWQFYLPKLPFMQPAIGPDYGFHQMYVETFFGAFGWLEVRFPERVYDALQVAVLLGLVALVVAAYLRRADLRPVRHVAFGLLGICVSLIALLHLVSYLALLGAPDPLIVGRYMLPLVVPFALAIAFVASSLPRRAGAVFGALVLAVGIVLQLSGLLLSVERFYA
ncbi:DUF2142 domain-containing protein [Conexibacter woesei]|nr:DUF2142 domain-containing protein [Conexibacter woesei]